MDAGELRERIEILALMKIATNYSWEVARNSWAKVEPAAKKRIFSTHTVSSEGINFTIRRQELTRANAIRYAGRHCFITSIVPVGRLHLRVEAALVDIVQCEDKYTGTMFPAIMSEIYARHSEMEPMDLNTLRHVLVTPKEITLVPGKLVDVDGKAWPILAVHELDPWHNDYEIERKMDL